MGRVIGIERQQLVDPLPRLWVKLPVCYAGDDHMPVAVPRQSRVDHRRDKYERDRRVDCASHKHPQKNSAITLDNITLISLASFAVRPK